LFRLVATSRRSVIRSPPVAADKGTELTANPDSLWSWRWLIAKDEDCVGTAGFWLMLRRFVVWFGSVASNGMVVMKHE
jgi:hypothetical protein